MRESVVYGIIAKFRNEVKLTTWNTFIIIVLLLLIILFQYFTFQAVTCGY